MRTETTSIDQYGRVLIPATIRKEYGLNPGDELLLRPNEYGDLQLVTAEQAMLLSQRLYRKYTNDPDYTVDDFIAERREEQRREDEKYDSL